MRGSLAVIMCALVCAPLSLSGQGVNLRTRQWNDPYVAIGNKAASDYTPAAALLSPY